MKKMIFTSIIALSAACTMAQNKVKVNADVAVNGSYTITPKLPKDGMVKQGTVLTIKATPDAGYAFDSGYHTSEKAMPWGRFYYEQMTPEFKITVKHGMDIGAYFVKEDAVKNLNITQDVVYAKPGVKTLKYDVFSPKNAKNLPAVVIIHGGGWSSNTEDIMRGMAREIANTGKYVVFSIDYRWIGLLDGDSTPNEMHQLIGDCYGAILHIIENASKYGADGSKLFVTGDSAGGHLSASMANFVEMVGDKGFGKTAGVYEYLPTYLPKGKTVAQAREMLAKSIKGAVPTYGVFTPEVLQLGKSIGKDAKLFSENDIKAFSPSLHIPKVNDRQVPQLLYRGTKDGLIKDEAVKTYLDALVEAGQRAEYIQVGGANHAFFDWKPEAKTQAVFEQYGIYHIQQMVAFFDSVLKHNSK